MNPDEFDLYSEKPEDPWKKPVKKPSQEDELSDDFVSPWDSLPDVELDSSVDLDNDLTQVVEDEEASIWQAEDNFMQAFIEPEATPTDSSEDLLAAFSETERPSVEQENPLPPLSLDMKQSAEETEALTDQGAEPEEGNDLSEIAPESMFPSPKPPDSRSFGEQNPSLTEASVTHPPAFEMPMTEPASFGSLAEREKRIAELQRQERALQQEIAELQATHAQLRQQIVDNQGALGRLVQEGLSELEQRKQALQISVEQLERRQDRIRSEMRTTFAGVSQDLAIRVQSFKDYLVGSLQDLALSAEQLELPKPSKESPRQQAPVAQEVATSQTPNPKFAEQTFQEQTRKIRSLLDQYRNRPDYYGPPWHLRRTFEPIHAERVSNWFFTQGGKGAIRTMGSRLQNILVASSAISILHTLYGDRLCALILAESPERLGEWRRGLQDCLGITRGDFGPERGVALFEDPEILAMKADRCLKDGLLPFIIIDETEDQISLSMLQFPMWLAFAPNPQAPSSYVKEW